MNRRLFLAASASAAASPLATPLHAQDKPDWGGPVLDIHIHPKGPGGEWLHMEGSGVSHALLLTRAGAESEAHAREEMAKHPGRFQFSVALDPARPETLASLRRAVKEGAKGFGEMKSPAKADGPEMMRVYELAAELSVPVTIHFADFPQFPGDTSYNEGITRFEAVLKKFPKVTFIGHADGFWANISAEVPPVAYPTGPIKPGGISDKLLRDYPNLYADMSANSCRNALARDEQFIRAFLIRHQDKLMFGSDCSCRDGRGAGQRSDQPLIKGRCVARETLTALKSLATPEVFRKIAWTNGARLLGYRA